jgi:hypothetical protein
MAGNGTPHPGVLMCAEVCTTAHKSFTVAVALLSEGAVAVVGRGW